MLTVTTILFSLDSLERTRSVSPQTSLELKENLES